MNLSLFSSKEVVEGIRDVAKGIIELIPKLQSARRDKRLRIANLMEQISDCLIKVSAEIRIGNQPHGQCGQLIGFAEQLPTMLKNAIGKNEANALGQQLHASYKVEELAMRLDRVKKKEPYLAKLEEASGKFRVVALVLRV